MFEPVKLNPKDGGWELGREGYVYIEPDVLQTIKSYRQIKASDTEAGGFLVGHFSGPHLHVTKLTAPYPKDIRKRCLFTRNDKRHMKSVRDWYSQSEGLINVIGEWHTHPEPYPTPSFIDLNSWGIIEKERNPLATVFLICGTKNIWVGVNLN